ncbi:uncharacterized protein TEOVI_000201500 [Trypanosoma equiperdum]|uniref:Kinetoplast ribosomal PPR-repeat containing protein 3 n=1 Tax=Trypanosoma equiperdum TaxID=5694 RepID=A0A1G4IEB1_TRYEQ|nr:hypothetical protein, conserved [Trypanosoma equiperdum]
MVLAEVCSVSWRRFAVLKAPVWKRFPIAEKRLCVSSRGNRIGVSAEANHLRPLQRGKTVRVKPFKQVKHRELRADKELLPQNEALNEHIIRSAGGSQAAARSAAEASCIGEDKAESGNARLVQHDPATVVTLDSQREELHLDRSQRELLWNARRRQYQQLLVRIVTCMESHLAPIEKCHVLLALHDEVIDKRIRLRVDTYEDIFHVFYAVGTLGSSSPSLDAEEVAGRTAKAAPSLLPAEFVSPIIAAASLLTGPMLQSLWRVYRYMIDSGTNPTSRVVQHVMGILERHRKKDVVVEARAHSLMMDLDRFHLAPTEYTIASYIGVCDVNAVMHLAVARVTDYRTRHERQVSAGVCARLLFGLMHNQQHDEALACLSSIDSTVITPQLLNAALHVTCHSRDPLSAFAIYKSVMGRPGGRASGMAPSEHTFTILLEAMEKAQSYGELNYFLREMRRFRVKGNGVTLNKILRVLLKLNRYEEASALLVTMDKKGVTVFDELRQEYATAVRAPLREEMCKITEDANAATGR